MLIIDGNSIINRAFYGIKLLSTKDGRFTNGIYGFLSIFLKLKDITNPEGVAVAFDLKAPTFRHKMYEGYKSGRKPMPEELASQMPVLKELLFDLGYKTVECEGYEADDILGTLAASVSDNDMCYIATGDRDSLQLVKENVHVLLASTKSGAAVTTEYDIARICSEYSVSSPEELIELKGIMGDTSDKIPGVPGIGQKGATELISNYHTIDYIYENLDSLDIKQGTLKKLSDGKEMAYLSRKLGTIYCDVPIERDLSFYKPHAANIAECRALLSSLEMFKMIDRLGLSGSNQDADAKEIRDEVPRNENILYIESGNYPEKNIIEDKTKTIVTDDSKPLYSYCLENGIEPAKIDNDVSLAGYILNPSSNNYSVETLSLEYRCGNSLAAVSDTLLKLIAQNDQNYLLHELEIPLAKVLASMEREGFLVDAAGIKEFGEVIGARLTQIEQNIFEEAGCTFNLNSPKQLSEVLFEKLGLPAKKKTKSGWSTNADVLEDLSFSYPIVAEILDYRTLMKLKSTYCDGLLKVVCDDGRIRSTFNQKETRTGRLSSTEPNLQNIPIRKPLGSELRKFFIAKPGYVLIDADYSQIELRVLASIADDKAMIEGFLSGNDIHRITASQVFKVPLDEVTPLMRTRAKAVNFGIVYGIGAFSLAKDIGVSRQQAQDYISGYLSRFSGVDSYMKNTVIKAKEDGYVKTLFNRRRYLPELSSGNGMLRAFGERVARNMPIQGTAADIIKIAMIKVYDRLQLEKLDAKLIMQVHDELIIEASEKDANRAATLLKEEMENAVKLKVPLTVDVHQGKNWLEAK